MFGLVINFINGSISPLYYVLFYYMFYTVVSITATDTKVWIILFTPSTSSIKVMLDQYDDPQFYDQWFTSGERLTHFIKAIYHIAGNHKGAEITSVRGPKYSEEDLILRVTISTQRSSLIDTGTFRNHAPVGQVQNVDTLLLWAH